MEKGNVLDILKDIISLETERLEVEIELGTRFMEDLHLDSFDMVGILMAVEDRLMIKMSETDLEGISTVADAVEKIADLL